MKTKMPDLVKRFGYWKERYLHPYCIAVKATEHGFYMVRFDDESNRFTFHAWEPDGRMLRMVNTILNQFGADKAGLMSEIGAYIMWLNEASRISETLKTLEFETIYTPEGENE